MKKIEPLKICIYVTLFESLSLFAFAVFVLFSSILSNSIESIQTLIGEEILYVLFAITLFLISRGLKQYKKVVYTPFILTQLFTIVIAWQYLKDDQIIYQIIGLIVALVAFFTIYIGLKPELRNKFYNS